MTTPFRPGFDTLALHAGATPDPATGARAVPIHLTTSFVFESADQAAALFNLEQSGHVYSRISNPTTAVLEERIAALDHGVAGIATASGQAALHLAITTLLSAGDHIVASAALYGGSHNLLRYTLPRFGIQTSNGERTSSCIRRPSSCRATATRWAVPSSKAGGSTGSGRAASSRR